MIHHPTELASYAQALCVYSRGRFLRSIIAVRPKAIVLCGSVGAAWTAEDPLSRISA